MDNAIWALRGRIDKTLLEDTKRRWMSDSQNSLREFYKTDVIPIKVDRTSEKHDILQNKINQLLEANIANDVRNLVMHSYVEIKNKEELERFSKESKDSNKFCNDVLEVKEKLSK
ncbi:hypothetical protein Tco_1476273 [Tanacetum coccineum]